MKTFEQYLQEIHAKDYRGVDDDMPDGFINWVCDFGPWEIIEMEKNWEKTLGFWEVKPV